MIRSEKVQLLEYCLSNACICGNPKERGTWVCPSCWNAISSSPGWEKVRETCKAHLESAKAILEVVRGRK